MPRPARHDGRRETGDGQDKEGPISDIVNPPLMGDSLLRNFKSGSHDHKGLGFEAINRSSSGEDGEGSRRKTGKNVFFSCGKLAFLFFALASGVVHSEPGFQAL